MRTQNEVAHVIQAIGDAIETFGLNNHQLRNLRAIRDCRTAALGGHIDACTSCGVLQLSYNSCRNRHCPKCQGHKREEWIQKREQELLPVPYFHVVFTLPAELNQLTLHEPKKVYDALFASAWQTLQVFAKKHNGQMGMISILHTWGQNLSLHPHLHCIVPAGVVDKYCRFKSIRSDGKFLFPVKAMSKVFRAKYVAALRQRGINDKQLIKSLFKKEWVIYAKRPFGNPKSVIEYLGRYTHKVAISNQRIQSIDDSTVTFGYKDYKTGATKKSMTLPHAEFIRRFAMHILPNRFVRIRHYGFLSSTWKRSKLSALRKTFHLETTPFIAQTKLHCCVHCKVGTLVTIEGIAPRGPPSEWLTGKKIKSKKSA